MRNTLRYTFSAVLCSIVASIAVAQLELPWYTIDSGGTTHSTGGDFELSGTIGQFDAGRLQGGPFELTGGFWIEQPPGDCVYDGVVNLFDAFSLVVCGDGPEVAVSADCACADLDFDGDVDLRDAAELQLVFYMP